MMKKEIDYSPAAGKAAIAALHGTAEAFGDFFPEGSDMGADTKAAAAIWENPEGWQAELDKFKAAAAAAMEASGPRRPGRSRRLPGRRRSDPRHLQELPREVPDPLSPA